MLHLLVLDAGAIAGTGLDHQFLFRIEEIFLQSSIQVLEVLCRKRSLEIQFISTVVPVVLCVFLLPIDSV